MPSSSSSPATLNNITNTSNIIKRKGGNSPNRRTNTVQQEWTTETDVEMAAAEAAEAAEDTPLVVGSAGDIEEGLEPAQLKPIKDGNMKETIVGVLAAMTVLASAFAMIINSGIMVIISGLFGVALAPYAAFQQQKITQTIAMKETNEYFEKQLIILKASNERLSEQNKHMTESVDNLKMMEKTLGTVQEMRGNCLQELESQLKKQREIAAMTSTNVKNVIVGNLFEIAMNCDDGDMELSDAEVDHLMEKIEHIAGVDVREAKVRKLIADRGRNLMSLMEVAKQALRDDIPEEEKLFVYVNN